MVPPELDSLMPPVSGLLQPMDRRLEVDRMVPEKKPVVKMRTLSGPSGSQVGSQYSVSSLATMPRPPKYP